MSNSFQPGPIHFSGGRKIF